ncbi:SAM-dependent methyltransferase [Actinoplanes sp. ATCC 53533]|uniref:SAM-dependent methyltransferase n=1 Tax=Actinoplanes sp. ATCC 53533 TaxID=1288362 RepID=UPI003512F4A3
MEASTDGPTPAKIDTSVPHSARIWNYWLGGKDNYPVDRAAGDQFRATFPGVDEVARASRQFLVRSIGYLAGEAGVRQFLDVGTGLPTADNTHEVAQRVAPEARIVYVDNDPLVLIHARALLTGNPAGATDYIDADLHDPGRILREAARTLDLTEPVALVLSGVLGHVADTGEARGIIGRLMEPLPSGSYLSLNDGTSVVAGPEADKALDEYADTGAVPYRNRTPAEIAGFFAGLELVDPGVVSVPHWRPEPGAEPRDVDAFGGVGRKP